MFLHMVRLPWARVTSGVKPAGVERSGGGAHHRRRSRGEPPPDGRPCPRASVRRRRRPGRVAGRGHARGRWPQALLRCDQHARERPEPMNGQNRRDPGYGKGTHEIDEVLVDAQDLVARLRATFEAPDYKPPLLPPVALQLLALSQRPNAAVGEMADLLEKDPLLAARVLKLVRSPLYLSESPIRSIKQAIVRLGLSTMRDLVMEAA